MSSEEKRKRKEELLKSIVAELGFQDRLKKKVKVKVTNDA